MLKKVVIFLVVLAAGVGIGTYLGPWTAEYDVKTAAKLACNTLIKNAKYNLPDDGKWRSDFERKARTAGVKLTKEQYAFSVERLGNIGFDRCNFKAAWRSTTPWLFVSDFFDGVPPLTLVHRLDTKHDVRLAY
jgi:hypothetical protein